MVQLLSVVKDQAQPFNVLDAQELGRVQAHQLPCFPVLELVFNGLSEFVWPDAAVEGLIVDSVLPDTQIIIALVPYALNA